MKPDCLIVQPKAIYQNAYMVRQLNEGSSLVTKKEMPESLKLWRGDNLNDL